MSSSRSSSGSPGHHHLGPRRPRLAQQPAGIAQLVRRVEVERDLGHRLSAPLPTCGLARFGGPCLGRRGTPCCAQQVLHQQAHRAAGRALGGAALPRGAGDVEVRPGILAGEALQELGRGDGAAGAARRCWPCRRSCSSAPSSYSSSSGMRQHGSSAASPAASSAAASASSVANRPLRTPPSAITQAPVSVAMSTTARRLEALGVGERVAQDQAAFGVGVEDLDGLPAHAGDDVARLDGAAVGHVLAGRDQADHVERRLQLGRCARNVPSTLAAPHMSNFISSISAAGLSEMPPVSKVMPLPTSTTGASLFGRAVVAAATMKRSGSSEPLRHREERAHAELARLPCGPAPRPAVRAPWRASWLPRPGASGVAMVRRQVAPVRGRTRCRRPRPWPRRTPACGAAASATPIVTRLQRRGLRAWTWWRRRRSSLRPWPRPAARTASSPASARQARSTRRLTRRRCAAQRTAACTAVCTRLRRAVARAGQQHARRGDASAR